MWYKENPGGVAQPSDADQRRRQALLLCKVHAGSEVSGGAGATAPNSAI